MATSCLFFGELWRTSCWWVSGDIWLVFGAFIGTYDCFWQAYEDILIVCFFGSYKEIFCLFLSVSMATCSLFFGRFVGISGFFKHGEMRYSFIQVLLQFFKNIKITHKPL